MKPRTLDALNVSLLALILSGEAGMHFGSEDMVNVQGYDVRLRSSETTCSITFTGPHQGETSLRLSPPCRFHRDTKGETRYMKVKSNTVLLVEHSQPAALESGSHSRGLCDTHIQGIVVGRQGVRASASVSSVKACPPFQWDQQMFLTFLEEIDP